MVQFKNFSTLKYFFFLLFLFFTALIVRTNNFFDSRDIPERNALAFSTIGTGSDQDYQLKCASLFARNIPGEFMTHYDYLFLCPMLAQIFRLFNFIDGLIVISVIIIFTGSVVSVFPFLLLSSPKKISFGGIIASLILIFNQVMIENASGRFYIYPLVSLFYIIYIYFLFQALRKKTSLWIYGFSLVAALQSLNKPFLFINDIPMMIIFFVFLLTKSFVIVKKFPYFQIRFDFQHLKRGITAVFLYFFITISYEIIHHQVTGGYSFLSDLFLNTGASSTKDAVLGASLHFQGQFYQKVKNILALSFLGVYLMAQYFNFWIIVLLTNLFNAFSRKKLLLWVLSSCGLITSFFIVLYLSQGFLFRIRLFVPIPELFTLDFIKISLLLTLIVQTVLIKKEGVALVSSQFFYLAALSMTLAVVHQPQLFVTILICLSLIVGLSIQNGFEIFISRFSTRSRLIAMVTFLVIFITPFLQVFIETEHQIQALRNEVRYLKWVATVVPSDGYIIGGAGDNLLLVSKITQRTVLMNGFYVASKIQPQNKIWENTEFYPNFPSFIKEQMILQNKKSNLFILDHDVPKWESYLKNGKSETYPKYKYKLQEITYSPYLNRKIFVLSDNPEYTPESSSSANVQTSN